MSTAPGTPAFAVSFSGAFDPRRRAGSRRRGNRPSTSTHLSRRRRRLPGLLGLEGDLGAALEQGLAVILPRLTVPQLQVVAGTDHRDLAAESRPLLHLFGDQHSALL